MNQREIKFRVWDTKQNVMLRYFEVDQWFESGIYLNHVFEEKRFIFQQYTGFKDKHNKEIYEGDILLYRMSYTEFMQNGGGDDSSIDCVVFDNGVFRLEMADSLFEYATDGTLDNEEIIGNILENPDMIKKL